MQQSLDLRGCVHVRRVLALYPYEPLPDIAFHAPLLPAYPPQALVEEDVTLGCHQGGACAFVRGMGWGSVGPV